MTPQKLIVPQDRKRYEVTLTLIIDAPATMGSADVLQDIVTGLTPSTAVNVERTKELNIEFVNAYSK